MNPTYQHYATHDESDFPHLWRGVVGSWAPCLGPSGLRLHDHSGRANWGTLTSVDAATDWLVDGGQYALDFDGTDDFVDCGTLPGFVAGDSFSVAGWIRINAVATNVGIVSGDQGPTIGADGWHFRILSTGAIRWIVYSDNSLNFWGSDSSALVTGKWYFFCGIMGPTSTTLTIDSTKFPQSLTRGTRPNVSGSFPLWLARYGAGHGNIRLDDVKIWQRPISENEIAELLQIGRGGMYTPQRRRRVYSFGPSFLAAWARGSNVILQPCGVS